MLNLGSVVLDAGINSADYDRQMKEIENRTMRWAAGLERRVSGMKLKLDPQVNHRNLNRLNEHYDLKQAHHNKVRKHLKSNPLAPSVDTKELDDLELRLGELSGGEISLKLAPSADLEGRISAAVARGLVDANANYAAAIALMSTEVRKSISLGFASQKGGLGSRILGGIFTGATEGVGREFATGFGLLDGSRKAAEKTVRVGKRVDANALDLGNSAPAFAAELLRTGSVSSAGKAGLRFSPLGKASGNLKKMFEIATAKPKDLDVGELMAVPEFMASFQKTINSSANLKKAITKQGLGKLFSQDNALRQRVAASMPEEAAAKFNEIDFQDPDAIEEFGRVLKKDGAYEGVQGLLSQDESLERRVQAVGLPIAGASSGNKIRLLSGAQDTLKAMAPAELMGELVNPALKELDNSLAFFKRIRQYRTIFEAEVKKHSVAPTMPDLATGERGHVQVIGGAMYREGEGRNQLVSSMDGLFPEHRLIGVANPDTDPAGKMDGLIGSIVSAVISKVAPEVAGDGDMNSSVANLVALMSNATDYAGFSPTTSDALANIMALIDGGAAPEDISTVSYSLGGSNAKDLAQLLEILGINSKTHAIAYPDFDLGQKEVANFTASMTEEDALGFVKGKLGVGGDSNLRTYKAGVTPGMAAHAPKHYFKNSEQVGDFYESIGVSNAPKPSAKNGFGDYMNRSSNYYELMGAVMQGESLIERGEFDPSLPTQSFAGGVEVSGREAISKAIEGLKILKVSDDYRSSTPEQQAINEGIFARLDSFIKSLLTGFSSEINSLMGGKFDGNIDELFAALKYSEQSENADKAYDSFLTGKPSADKSGWANDLTADGVSRELDNMAKALAYFKGLPETEHSNKTIETLENLKAVMIEYSETGKLSEQTKASIKRPELPEVPDRLRSVLEATADPRTFASPEGSRELKVKEAVWMEENRAAVIGYNNINAAMGEKAEKLPGHHDMEHVGYGFNRDAASFISGEQVFKARITGDADVATPGEIEAYKRLEGRHSPALYDYKEGEYVVTERAKGVPARAAIDDLAAPVQEKKKELEAARKRVSGITEEADPETIKSLRDDEARLSEEFNKAKDRFNKEAEKIFTEVGKVGATLSKMGVAHMDLDTSNVFVGGADGTTAIDLANAKVDPNFLQQGMPERIAVHRMEIDPTYEGIIDKGRQARAISKGFSKPMELQEKRIVSFDDLPNYGGEKAIPLGSETPSLIEQFTGGHKDRAAEIRRERQEVQEAKAEEARKKTEAKEKAKAEEAKAEEAKKKTEAKAGEVKAEEVKAEAIKTEAASRKGEHRLPDAANTKDVEAAGDSLKELGNAAQSVAIAMEQKMLPAINAILARIPHESRGVDVAARQVERISELESADYSKLVRIAAEDADGEHVLKSLQEHAALKGGETVVLGGPPVARAASMTQSLVTRPPSPGMSMGGAGAAGPSGDGPAREGDDLSKAREQAALWSEQSRVVDRLRGRGPRAALPGSEVRKADGDSRGAGRDVIDVETAVMSADGAQNALANIGESAKTAIALASSSPDKSSAALSAVSSAIIRLDDAINEQLAVLTPSDRMTGHGGNLARVKAQLSIHAKAIAQLIEVTTKPVDPSVREEDGKTVASLTDVIKKIGSQVQREGKALTEIKDPQELNKAAQLLLNGIKEARAQLEVTQSAAQEHDTPKGTGSKIGGLKNRLNHYEGEAQKAIAQAGEAMGGAGENFGDSMSQALEAEVDRLYKAGAAMATATITGAKDKLEIRSPSRVGLGIGQNFGESIGSGVESQKDSVVMSVDNLLSPIEDAKGRVAGIQFKLPEVLTPKVADRARVATFGLGMGARIDTPAASGAVASTPLQQLPDAEPVSIAAPAIETQNLDAVEQVFFHAGERAGASMERGLEILEEAVPEALKSYVKPAFEAAKKYGSSLIGGFDEGMGGKTDSLIKLGKLSVAAFAAFKTFEVLSGLLRELGGEALETAVRMERLENVMNFASGGKAEGAESIAMVRAEVDRLNIDLESSLSAYAQLKAATKDTAMEGSATDTVFRGAAQATSVYGLDAQDTELVFLALNQIAGKSVVSMEELRQQLGERLPGAMNIAARSMGMTVQEFNKLVESGGLLAEDFLPRFGQQLLAETAAAVPAAQETTQARRNRARNALTDTKAAVGRELQPFENVRLDLVATGAEALEGNLDKILGLFKAIALATALQGAISAGAFAKSELAAKGYLAVLKLIKADGFAGPKAIGSGLLKFGSTIALAVAALEGLKGAWGIIRGTGDEIRGMAEEAKLANAEIEQAFAQSRGESESSKPAPRQSAEDLNSSNLFVRGADEYKRMMKDEIERHGGSKPGLVNPVTAMFGGLDYLSGGRLLSTSGVKRENDLSMDFDSVEAQINTTLENAYKILQDTTEGVASVRNIDEQIQTVQAQKRAVLISDPGNKERLDELQGKQDSLIKRREDKFAPIGATQGALEAQKRIIESSLKDLEGRRITDDKDLQISDDFYQKQKATLEADLKSVEDVSEKLSVSVAKAGDSILVFSRTLRSASDRFSDAQFFAGRERRLTQAEIESKQARGLATEGQAQSQAAIADYEENFKGLIAAQKLAQEIRAELSMPENVQTLNAIGVTGQEGPARLKSLTDDFKDSPKEKSLLEGLSSLRDAESQIDNYKAGLPSAERALVDQVKSTNKSVRDYMRDLGRSMSEMQSAIEETNLSAQGTRFKAQITSALSSGHDNVISQYVDSLMGLFDKLMEPIQGAIDFNRQKAGLAQTLEDQLLNTREIMKAAPGGYVSGSDAQAASLVNPAQSMPQGSTVGLVGNTGIGSGAHLDIRYSSSYVDGAGIRTPQGYRPALSDEHLSRFSVGGKTLDKQDDMMTSGYGPRNLNIPGASKFHEGLDFGFSKGEEITTTVPVKSQKMWKDEAGGGWVNTVEFEDGVIVNLLHLDPGSRQAISNSAAKSSTPATSLAQGGTTGRVVIPLDHARGKVPDATGGNTFRAAGATGASYGGYTERDFQDAIIPAVQANLEAKGFEVVVLKPEDFASYDAYDDRLAQLSQDDSTVVTPIHYDALEDFQGGYKGGYLTRTRAGDSQDARLGGFIREELDQRVAPGSASRFLPDDTLGNETINVAAAAPAALVEFGAMGDFVNRYGGLDGYMQSQEAAATVEAYGAGVSRFFGGSPSASAPVAPIAPQAVSTGVNLQQAMQLLEGNSNSYAARVIGIPEGTRNLDGSFTSAGKSGHLDPGNAAANMGSFSAQGVHNRGTAEASDRAVIDNMLKPIVAEFIQVAGQSGVEVTPKLLMNYLDAHVQSPAAARTAGSGTTFLNGLDMVKGRENDDGAILGLRRAMYESGGQHTIAGHSVEYNQNDRMQKINRGMAAAQLPIDTTPMIQATPMVQPTPMASQAPAANPVPTTGLSSRSIEYQEQLNAITQQNSDILQSGNSQLVAMVNAQTQALAENQQAQAALSGAEFTREENKSRISLDAGLRDIEDRAREQQERLLDTQAGLGPSTIQKENLQNTTGIVRSNADTQRSLLRERESLEGAIATAENAAREFEFIYESLDGVGPVAEFAQRGLGSLAESLPKLKDALAANAANSELSAKVAEEAVTAEEARFSKIQAQQQREMQGRFRGASSELAGLQAESRTSELSADARFDLRREIGDNGVMDWATAKYEELESVVENNPAMAAEAEKLRAVYAEIAGIRMEGLGDDLERQRRELEMMSQLSVDESALALRESKLSNANLFGFNPKSEREAIASSRVNSDYAREARRLDGMTVGVDIETEDQLRQLKDNALELRDVKLDGLRAEFSPLTEGIRGAKNELSGFIQALGKGEGFGSAFSTMLGNIGSQLLQLGTDGLLDQLFGAFSGGGGKGKGKGGGGGGLLGGLLGGGGGGGGGLDIGTSIFSFLGFRGGGRVPNFKEGGLMSGTGQRLSRPVVDGAPLRHGNGPLARALGDEGPGGIVSVLHPNEMVLTQEQTRLYFALEMDKMMSGAATVPNYKQGKTPQGFLRPAISAASGGSNEFTFSIPINVDGGKSQGDEDELEKGLGSDVRDAMEAVINNNLREGGSIYRFTRGGN